MLSGELQRHDWVRGRRHALHPGRQRQQWLQQQFPSTRCKINDAAHGAALRAGAQTSRSPRHGAGACPPLRRPQSWLFAQAQWVGVATLFRVVAPRGNPVGRFYLRKLNRWRVEDCPLRFSGRSPGLWSTTSEFQKHFQSAYDMPHVCTSK